MSKAIKDKMTTATISRESSKKKMGSCVSFRFLFVQFYTGFFFVTPFCFQKASSIKKKNTVSDNNAPTKRYYNRKKNPPSLHTHKKRDSVPTLTALSDSSFPFIAVNQSHVPICVLYTINTHIRIARTHTVWVSKKQHNTQRHTAKAKSGNKKITYAFREATLHSLILCVYLIANTRI